MMKDVVLCKYCKHMATDTSSRDSFNWEWPDDMCPYNCEDPFYSFIPKDDDYCSRGEER